MMLSYVHGDHLMAKTTPSLMSGTKMTSATSEAVVPSGEGQRTDESGQGPRRAVAEAVVRPLGVQPCMYITSEESSSKRPVARARCSYKLRPPPGATAVSRP